MKAEVRKALPFTGGTLGTDAGAGVVVRKEVAEGVETSEVVGEAEAGEDVAEVWEPPEAEAEGSSPYNHPPFRQASTRCLHERERVEGNFAKGHGKNATRGRRVSSMEFRHLFRGIVDVFRILPGVVLYSVAFPFYQVLQLPSEHPTVQDFSTRYSSSPSTSSGGGGGTCHLPGMGSLEAKVSFTTLKTGWRRLMEGGRIRR